MFDRFPADDDLGPETPAGPVTAEELDQAILDDFPGLTKEDLALIAKIT